MARPGRRYPLVLYTYMLNRWWPATLFLSAGLFALAWVGERYLPEADQAWRWQALLAVGVFTLLMTAFLFLIRKAAYVQLFHDHFRLVTPFLRLNISYKRIQKTSSATVNALFPPKSLSGWQREILAPLGAKTAVVIHLNGYPVSRSFLRFFLSPFFFADKTPHFVLLVDDWMRFSMDLESLRTGKSQPAPKKRIDSSILARLPRK
ncbi:MAG: hypothetical protein ACP5QU_03470 [Anaerolineae bacterium]